MRVKLTVEEVRFRWRRLYLQLEINFRFLMITQVKKALNPPDYQEWIDSQATKVMPPRGSMTKQLGSDPNLTPTFPKNRRYVGPDGQVELVGPRLPMGQGAKDLKGKTKEPSFCEHEKLTRRAGRGQKTWICLACLSRWERLSARETPPEEKSKQQPPPHEEILTWGPHTNERFQDAAQDTQWVREIIDQFERHPIASDSPQAQFIRYLVQTEHQSMVMAQVSMAAQEAMVVDSSEGEWDK